MVAPLDPKLGLPQAFAEYSLLPDLLAATPSRFDFDEGGGEGGGGETLGFHPYPRTLVMRGVSAFKPWPELLSQTSFNRDHVGDDIPVDADLTMIMATDAWNVSESLELVSLEYGPSVIGAEIARVAGIEREDRTEATWEIVQDALLAQIRKCYLSADGTSIALLVEDAARVMADVQGEWAQYCPGLLPVEFEALLYLAQIDAQYAKDFVYAMGRHRNVAMRDVGPPPTDSPFQVNMITHADRVTDYYVETLIDHVNEDILSPTAVQATAILFVFCGLLEVPHPEYPVQVLVVPDD